MAAPIFTVQLVDATTGAPVADALTSLSVPGGPQDVDAYSDDQGKVRFRLRKRHVEDARLLVQPGRGGHWGLFLDNVDIANGDVFKLESVDLDQKNDCLRQLLRPGHAEHGRGVKVGILDSGVGPHPDLPNVTGDLDNSRAHGTHVAGIIGGRGAGNKAGVAPGVSLMSYQIADDPETGAASNFQIFSAVSKAIDDGCDIINLSFKDENETDEHFDDPVLSSAIRDACDRGILCVAAAGNDGRRHVAFPARHPDAVSVAALGWEPGLPQNAYDRITINDPRGRDDGALFFGSFSNIGTEGTQVDIVAPGVGVVSTIPGGQYVPLSGTSMACPATVGMVARLLGERPDILNMERSRPRMEAIKALLFENSSTSGFDREYEGHGMPHDDWSRATV
ncbi:S8 family serine peptidase [Ahrensia sp. R2A130]|uniref:S8 family peptidase n=1 Tax=Ahrensia sp. R2A130 TaxID=744979 RepID=UPI0018DC16BF|nr:S8 family serine peptidase [Ahrensia sp. R2A130]